MLSHELIARLERLNRERILPAAPRATIYKPEALARESDATPSLALRACVNRETPRIEDEADLSLARLVSGEVIDNDSGRHYAVSQSLAALDGDFSARLVSVAEHLRCKESHDGERHAELATLIACFPRGTLFLDLETCGFAGSPIFLVGLLRHGRQGIVLEQLLARDYSEERAMLVTLWRRVASCRVLVTFNGKSFDWPMVRDRSTYHRLDGLWRETIGDAEAVDNRSLRARGGLLHCDLLHHARRRWRRRLPNCKLQTLERYVCRRLRRDDVSGSRIPQEYHQFVRTGDARQMCSILQHNALDLLTLAELALRVAA